MSIIQPKEKQPVQKGMLQVRLYDDEKDFIKDEAKRHNMDVNEFLMTLVITNAGMKIEDFYESIEK